MYIALGILYVYLISFYTLSNYGFLENYFKIFINI